MNLTSDIFRFWTYIHFCWFGHIFLESKLYMLIPSNTNICIYLSLPFPDSISGDRCNLQQVQRCAELIQKVVLQLMNTSRSDSSSAFSDSLLGSSVSPQKVRTTVLHSWQSSFSDSASIFSESQAERLNDATEEVLLASRLLAEHVQKVEHCRNGLPNPLHQTISAKAHSSVLSASWCWCTQQQLSS